MSAWSSRVWHSWFVYGWHEPRPKYGWLKIYFCKIKPKPDPPMMITRFWWTNVYLMCLTFPNLHTLILGGPPIARFGSSVHFHLLPALGHLQVGEITSFNGRCLLLLNDEWREMDMRKSKYRLWFTSLLQDVQCVLQLYMYIYIYICSCIFWYSIMYIVYIG